MNAKPLLFGALMLAVSAAGQPRAEERQAGYVQLAELDVDPAQLESYEAAAKEQIETAIRVEPGVLALYCVADKNNPSHIRVFEMYTGIDAYKAHLESAHFKKYKAATQAMVKSLNLVPMKSYYSWRQEIVRQPLVKPYLICHMIASVDGRTLLRRWRPVDEGRGHLFERLHERLGSDAWLVGRATGQEYAKRDAYPEHADQTYPREPWFARHNAAAYGIVLDAHGKIAWGRADIGGDPIVVVLTEAVSDAHLAGLRKDGVSYIFAGERELNLGRALHILNEELDIKRLELNGGGITNGSFLRAGLIDEISVAIFPAVDGAKGAPCVFDSRDAEAGTAARVRAMTLASSEVLEGGAVWLRYRVQAG